MAARHRKLAAPADRPGESEMEPSPQPIPWSRAALSPFERRRRDFLKQVSAGALALPGVAGPFFGPRPAARGADGAGQEGGAKGAAGLSADHFVPLDKKLDPKWVARLFERGE